MHHAIDRLLSLRVSDLVGQAIVTVSTAQTMAEAAGVLVRNKISGAPVVDAAGHCVGMLSSVDFVRRELHLESSDAAGSTDVEHRLTQSHPEQPLHIETISEHLVSEHMTQGVQTVSADETLLKASRMMCTEHVHRLPVVDRSGQLIGVVSSLDIVAALVKSMEE
jgi:CBS domain-containing protein